MADCIINIVFRRKPTEFTIDQKLTLNQLKVFANIFYTDFFEVTNKSDSKLSLIGMAKLTDNQKSNKTIVPTKLVIKQRFAKQPK